MNSFPSTKSYPHKYELVIDRKNTAGRALSSLTVLQSDDRDAVQAEHDRRLANGQTRGSTMKIHERLTHDEARAAQQGG